MRTSAALLTLLLLLAPSAAAQTAEPRLAHGDASLSLGWTHDRTPGGYRSDAWSQDSLASFELGWYWTDNWKSAIEVTTGHRYRAIGMEPLTIAGRPYDGWWTDDIRQRRLSVAGQYQFGRNRWVHAFLTAGVDILHERRTRTEMDIFAYDLPYARIVRPRSEREEPSRLLARALVGGGAKTYFSQRVFMLTDVRVSLDPSLRAVILRAGLGVDF